MSENPTMTDENLWALVRETENGFRFLGDLLFGLHTLQDDHKAQGAAHKVDSRGKQGSPGDEPLGRSLPGPGSLGQQEWLEDQRLGRSVPAPGVLGQQPCGSTIICGCDSPPWCEMRVTSVRRLATELSMNAAAISVELERRLASLPDDTEIYHHRTTVLDLPWLQTRPGQAPGPGR